jgi:predicted transcriptional regulator
MHSVIGVACFVSARQNCSDNAVATVMSEVIARQPHLPERVG